MTADWVDRGADWRVAQATLSRAGLGLVAASRSATVGVEDGIGIVWLVVRGSASVTAREGRFHLRAGDWIALGRDAQPTLITGRGTLALGLLAPMAAASAHAFELPGLPPVHPGRGALDVATRRRALRFWRQAWTQEGATDDLLPRLGHLLSGVQEEVVARLARCPGRTLARRQQVLSRMQRAALYLEGHHDRPVRVEELARLTSFSLRHFAKTFVEVYGCVPREMTGHLRLRAAADLLATTALSIGEVGSRCGYQNACSFARAFRAYHGASASSYRRRVGTVPVPNRQSVLAADARRAASNRSSDATGRFVPWRRGFTHP